MLITEANLLIMAFFGYVGIQGLNDMSIKDSSRYLILNLIILYVIYKFFYIISNRLWVSFAAGGFVWYVMGLVNHYVGETRGVMFLPWDIMAFKTAADVAGAYEYHLYPQAVLWLLFIILTCIAAFRYHKPFFKGKPFLIYALISFVLCNLLMLGMVKSDRYKEIPDRLYLIERYYRTQGFPVSFFHYSKFLFIEKPQGYSVAQCEQGVEELRVAAALDKIDNADKIHAENVIVIMNEAFADFKTLGDLPEADDALLHFHGVSENAVTGNLYVPVFGGTTVNSEYEFLTANSIAYQKGCPFSYAVRDERPSIASYLKNLGYTAYGFHPATAVNWNRGKVYPLLGFERFYSIEDFEGQEIPVINEHPVDGWDVDRLIEMY
ncbi:MAG: sulfatase-like hydrolase/transferase, partial [Lachnospiraceae bacterium]|nr:sulfatase-like hydrolase/transferase [Lachnospiraceae bacterium]